jgi:anti-anti-sigma factor
MGYLIPTVASRHPLEYSVKDSTISLRGDLDPSSVTGLRATFAGITAPETIDMSGVRMVTSAALIEFLTLANRIGPRKIVLLNAQPTVARLFRVLGLDRIFLLAEHADGSVATEGTGRRPARTRKP